VFSGTNEGSFFALDAASGKPLWRFETGAQDRGNPISYGDERRQHVVVASGRALFCFALP
jgi:alcohol dehydrogenase (cytochrome c)